MLNDPLILAIKSNLGLTKSHACTIKTKKTILFQYFMFFYQAGIFKNKTTS